MASNNGKCGPMAEVHLTPDDLAARFRVPKKTIYKMNSDGTGPKYIRVGKHARYREADVRAWEDAHYVQQGAA
ncbi:helix-turn-helix transcriptional regulator [Nonomuraea antri]|uniref:helix-turn-helix transcriptional regulator n=1 Tax=Nonomuraea antri TaxID=2730852 RepID=UPI001C2C2A5A|nr:helix-turn-helix domain-containing protein [Nonomuraea antri]